jgi:hypothetical protein
MDIWARNETMNLKKFQVDQMRFDCRLKDPPNPT